MRGIEERGGREDARVGMVREEEERYIIEKYHSVSSHPPLGETPIPPSAS